MGRLVLLVLAVGLGAITAQAQLPSRVAGLVLEASVPADRLDITDLVGAAVTPAGDLVVGDPNDLVVVTISPSGSVRRFGRDGEGPGEFRNIREIGFSAGLVWVADSRLQRIQGFALDGTLRHTVRYQAFANLPDGTRLIVRPVAMVDTATVLFHATVTAHRAVPVGADRVAGTVGAVVGPSSGDLLREVAWSASGNDCLQVLEGGLAFHRPFCASAAVAFAPDGRGVLVVEAAGGRVAPHAVRVDRVAVPSQVSTATTVAYPGRRLRPADWDSVQARAAQRAARSPSPRSAMAALPRDGSFPSFGSAVLLGDQTALVEVFPEMRGVSTWVAIVDGRAVARLELPVGERPLAGTRERLWVSTVDADGLIGMRRYRVSLEGR